MGDFIGTDRTGNSSRANGGEGVAIFDSPSNFSVLASGGTSSPVTRSPHHHQRGNARFNVVSANVIGADLEREPADPERQPGSGVTSGASDNVIAALAGVDVNIIASTPRPVSES